MKPKELEKRLSTSYDAGYFDGYCGAIDAIHKNWSDALDNTKGIGPVLRSRIFMAMHEAYSQMRSSQGGDEEARKLVNDTLSVLRKPI